ncbi:MAG: hypothetical protein FWD73_07035 [Polyangiaceae bacterium]|nr:hypothetical protein [Polyangiaceae bacterium]
MSAGTNRVVTYDEWKAEGVRRFGKDMMTWRFVCPACGHVIAVRDWAIAGAPKGAVGFSCVGRWLLNARDAFGTGPGPCNYAGGGLFGLNPVTITDGAKDGGAVHYFDFAE